jgi:hypothetical protein
LETSTPGAPLLDRLRELLDHLEVHVRLEQGEADLAHRLGDVVVGQRAALADAGQGVLELLCQRVEHRGLTLRASGSCGPR